MVFPINNKSAGVQVMVWHYNMTVWILAGNGTIFTIAAGLNMPGAN